MLHQALREAGHSSQSCFHISFLTQKGILGPTTLVAFFFSLRYHVCHLLTIWEWSRWLRIGIKRGTCRVFWYRPSRCVTVITWLFFWLHLQCLLSSGRASALICRLQPLVCGNDERLSVAGWVCRCDFDLRPSVFCCGWLWLFLHTCVLCIYIVNHRTIRHQCQKNASTLSYGDNWK